MPETPAVTPDEQRAISAATHPAYRPDIDGLRALAVLPVVLYHAGVRGFSGGFVGVDIFFVISGYLITGILVRDVAIGRHSISEFYRRRVLRIFPALFAMFAVATAVACYTMLPSEIVRFARSLGAAAIFGSNVEFYRESGYFGIASAVKPLLHTWSLAIEEQWYILWPLLIAFVGSRRPDRLAWMTAGIVAVSLAVGIWQTATNAEAAFYLLPARAWELGLGAMLAVVPRRVSTRWILELCGVAGLALILASVKLYTHDTNFPGIAALAPCLGAALLIYSGSSGTVASRMLSIAPAQFVGRISYSLYLWHWPVIVFARLGLFLPATTLVAVGEVGASLVLAVLSWRFVEQPFRGVARWRTRSVLSVAVAAIAWVVALAAVAPSLSSRAMRFTARQTRIARYADLDGDALYRRGECFAVGPRSHVDLTRCLATDGAKQALVFVGDSHAAHLWPGLSRLRNRYAILQATATGCVAKLQPRPERRECERVINGVLRDWLTTHRPAALVLASRWTPREIPGIEATLADSLVRAAHPILVGPMPEYSAALPRLLVFADRRGDPTLVARALDPSVFVVDRTLRDIAARTGTPYVSLIDALCERDPARGCVAMTPADAPLQFDPTHLTAEGSAFVIDRILPQIEAAVAR